jgi:serine/threonine protein kinase
LEKHGTKISYVTPTMRDAIDGNQPEKLVVILEKQSWLILKYLSGGGHGTISIACPLDPDATADDLVALKIPKATLDPKSLKKAQQYLLNESSILSRLKQTPYIATFVDHSPTLPALATRLVHGPSLEQRVYDERRLSVFEVVSIGINVCGALTLLHEIGHIHKDVKPANIVLEANHNAVLIDFGLAEIPDPSELRSNGTPYYIAPEVYLRQEVPDARADVFSLAAVLFHALAGQPPHFQQCLNPNHYRASGAELDLKRFLHEQSAIDCDITDIRADVPTVLSLLLSLSLSTARDARPAAARMLCQTLTCIQQSLLEASEIEKRLWSIFKILLEAYREFTRKTSTKTSGKTLGKSPKTSSKRKLTFLILPGFCSKPILGSDSHHFLR